LLRLLVKLLLKVSRRKRFLEMARQAVVRETANDLFFMYRHIAPSISLFYLLSH